MKCRMLINAFAALHLYGLLASTSPLVMLEGMEQMMENDSDRSARVGTCQDNVKKWSDGSVDTPYRGADRGPRDPEATLGQMSARSSPNSPSLELLSPT